MSLAVPPAAGPDGGDGGEAGASGAGSERPRRSGQAHLRPPVRLRHPQDQHRPEGSREAALLHWGPGHLRVDMETPLVCVRVCVCVCVYG